MSSVQTTESSVPKKKRRLQTAVAKSCFQEVGSELFSIATEYLFPHQLAALAHVRSLFDAHHGFALCSMATGTGKSGVGVLVPYMLQSKRVLVVAPTPQLAGQLFDAFRGDPPNKKPFVMEREIVDDATGEGKWRPTATVVKQTRDLAKSHRVAYKVSTALNFDVVLTNTDKWGERTRASVLDFTDEFDLVIIDEAHQMPAETVGSVFKHFRRKGVFVLLLTATHVRSDKQQLVPDIPEAVFKAGTFRFGLPAAMAAGVVRPVCDTPVLAPHAIEDDTLAAKFEQVSKSLIQRETVVSQEEPNVSPEAAMVEVEEPMAQQQATLARHFAVVLAVVRQLQQHDGQQCGVKHLALVVTPTTEVSTFLKRLCDDLLPQWRTECYNGSTKKKRESYLAQFRAGQVRVLFVVHCLLEGFDESKVSVVGMLKPSMSLLRYSQIMGRAIRKHRSATDTVTATVVTSIAYEDDAKEMHRKYLNEEFGRSDTDPLDAIDDDNMQVQDKIHGVATSK